LEFFPSPAPAKHIACGCQAQGLAADQGSLAAHRGGHAAALGRLDGSLTCQEAIAGAAAIAAAIGLPVSADLENGFAHEPAEVARMVELAREAGLAGCSIEDFSGEANEPIYPLEPRLASRRPSARRVPARRG
jgi:2-methylisocitrate lyase-like PEP mutase family enzyme